LLGLGLLVTAAGALVPRTAAGQQVVPPVSHVVLIMMENRDYDAIIGKADAPYVNQLAAQFALANAYYGVRHPSLPNYLALLGGDTFGIDSDCTSCFVDAPNLVDALEAAGKTWKSYQEDLPSPCFLGASAGRYVLKHDPFLYFRDIRDDPSRCHQVVPLSQFADDLQAGTLPDLAWISPNLRHDMHDGSVAEGDQWLANFVPPILASDPWGQDGLLLIAWDEGDSNAGCCGLADGGHVPLLLVTPKGKPGYQSPVPATHYNLLRTIEDLLGLGYVGHSGDPDVQPLVDVFE
jgi:phosphatidylinositol-3-phosphatase